MFPNCHDISSPSAHSHFFAAEVTILPGASLSRAHTRAKTSAAKIWLGGWGAKAGPSRGNGNGRASRPRGARSVGNAFPRGRERPSHFQHGKNFGRKIGKARQVQYSG